MEFIDGDDNIIVPKPVRPIIDLYETNLGSKKGAKKQYRQGNLHIREYDDHYTVHMDSINPEQDPLGHLLFDAPEYVVGATAAIIAGKQIGSKVYNKLKKEGKSSKDSGIHAVITGYIVGSSAGKLAFDMTNILKKRSK